MVEVKLKKGFDLISDGIMDDGHVITCVDKNGWSTDRCPCVCFSSSRNVH